MGVAVPLIHDCFCRMKELAHLCKVGEASLIRIKSAFQVFRPLFVCNIPSYLGVIPPVVSLVMLRELFDRVENEEDSEEHFQPVFSFSLHDPGLQVSKDSISPSSQILHESVVNLVIERHDDGLGAVVWAERVVHRLHPHGLVADNVPTSFDDTTSYPELESLVRQGVLVPHIETVQKHSADHGRQTDGKCLDIFGRVSGDIFPEWAAHLLNDGAGEGRWRNTLLLSVVDPGLAGKLAWVQHIALNHERKVNVLDS